MTSFLISSANLAILSIVLPVAWNNLYRFLSVSSAPLPIDEMIVSKSFEKEKEGKLLLILLLSGTGISFPGAHSTSSLL